MKTIEPECFQKEIQEILEYLKSFVKTDLELNNLNKINTEVFADQLKEEYEQGVIITKKYIYLCFMETLKRNLN
jgi:hypothetical protein